MSLNYRIDVDLTRAPDAAKMQAQHDEVVGAKMTEMGLVVERLVKEETPIGATGILRGSVFSEPRGNPIREVIVASTQLYAPPVERGRQPGKVPPIGPIELWVKRKGLQPRSPKQTLRQIAYAVAFAIARKGTQGAAMFFKGYTKAQPVLQRLANEMGGAIVAEWEKQ